MDTVLQAEHVYFTYDDIPDQTKLKDVNAFNGKWALSDVSCAIKRGTYTAIIGPNGSGKSTLARHFNALLLPQFGHVTSFQIDSQTETQLFELRRLVGMVFQNPDNQIIGTTVEEDMAFGPENLAIPPTEIRERIKAALKLLQMENLAKQAPSNLSGGQKQKLAVGSTLVMQPEALVLDEATSMLDPDIRRELLSFIRELRLQRGLTVVNVTHHLDELMTADQVLVLAKGKLVRAYTPLDLFNDDAILDELALRLPGQVALLKAVLKAKGVDKLVLPDLEQSTLEDALEQALSNMTVEQADNLEEYAKKLDEAAQILLQRLKCKLSSLEALSKIESATKQKDERYGKNLATLTAESGREDKDNTTQEVIRVRNLSYRYPEANQGDNFVLDNISFDVYKGEILALVGHSGSGKSTLIMHLNALLKNEPQQVIVGGLDASNKANFLTIRRQVALLFQYPEHQLFAESIYKDIAYGPTKLGYTEDKVQALVKLACDMLGFSEDMLTRSPFELSGGQMRKVALAGIIAMWPEVFVLDEPAAGLDDKGRNEIFNYIKLLKKLGKTIIVVSHNMEDVAEFADRVLIMKGGRLVKIAQPQEIFVDQSFLKANSLAQPALTRALQKVKTQLNWPVTSYAPTLAQALMNLAQSIKAKEDLVCK